MIVVDASAVINAIADDEGPGRIARERLRQEQGLAAPHLLDLEVVAVLRRLVSCGWLTADRAELALADLSELDLDRWDHGGLVRRIWALRGNLTAYDAAYLALAEEIGCPLVTGDARLAKAAEHARSPAAVEVLTT